MAEVQIDNKKMWEAMAKFAPNKESLLWVNKCVESQGLKLNDNFEIVTIEPEAKVKFTIPDDMDKECIELCVKLNELSHVKTLESCCGHLKDCYMVFFECDDFIRLGKLFRCVNRNYSDGKWRIEVHGTDCNPHNEFMLTSNQAFSSYDEMKESVNLLIDNITYWENPVFDNYFKTGESVKPDYPLIPDDYAIVTKDHYTDEERKELCDGCQEECEVSKNIPMFKEVERNGKVELTDFEKVLAECIHKAQGSVLTSEGVAITWSDALMAEAKKQIAS